MSLEDYPVPSRPLYVIEQRILYFSHPDHTDRLLSGVTYDRESKIEPLTNDLLPLIQVADFTGDEAIFPGAPKPGHGRGNTPVAEDGILRFLISSRREWGFIQRDFSDPEDGRGVKEWCDRFKDALETNHLTGQPDAMLQGTIVKPLEFSVRDNFRSDLCFTALVEVRWQCFPYCRGERTP